MISIVKFNIESGKKHQIRAHASQVLHCPIIFDTKYGFELEDFKSANLRRLLKAFPEKFYAEARASCGGELQKALLKNYLASLQDNGTILLHSFAMRFDFERPTTDADEADEQPQTVRNEAKVRLSLQTRSLLDMLAVREADIYADADL